MKTFLLDKIRKNGQHTIQRLTHYPKANTLSDQRRVGHTAWTPEGRERRSQASSQREVGPGGPPWLLVYNIRDHYFSTANLQFCNPPNFPWQTGSSSGKLLRFIIFKKMFAISKGNMIYHGNVFKSIIYQIYVMFAILKSTMIYHEDFIIYMLTDMKKVRQGWMFTNIKWFRW